MAKHFVQLWMLLGCITLGIGNPVGSETEAHSTCTYTFHMPVSNGEACLPGGQSAGHNDEAINALQTFLSNQHAFLTKQLAAMSDKIDLMGQGENNNGDGANGNEGESNNASCTGGSNYVHYGRTTCPDTAQLIYEGYVAKSHYQHGGGVNYLCLPKEPEFPDGVAAGHQSESYVYGVEYEQHNSPVLDPGLWQHDVPCAVCEAQGRIQQLTIPAKKSCPSGWTKEYSGLLMADHHTHKGSDFVCVADGMETVAGGATDTNGGLLYVVEAVCGALPCPPYTDGYEIACVVCTK